MQLKYVAPNWQSICLDLRRHYKPLARVAKEIGSDERHINRIARGEVTQPRHSVGEKLLELHRSVMAVKT